jgi:hypothetical protein
MPDVHRRSQLHPLRPSCSQANESARRLQNEAAANELLDNVGDLTSARCVNAFLGNLVKQLAHKRITRRDAVAFAYISQLLLNSVSALDRERKSEDDDDDEQTSSLLLSMFHRRDKEDNHATTDGRACP